MTSYIQVSDDWHRVRTLRGWSWQGVSYYSQIGEHIGEGTHDRNYTVLEFRKREQPNKGRLCSILGRGCSRYAPKMLLVGKFLQLAVTK